MDAVRVGMMAEEVDNFAGRWWWWGEEREDTQNIEKGSG